MAEKRESNTKYVLECGRCKSELHVSKQRMVEGKDCPFCKGPLIHKYVSGVDYSSSNDVTVSQLRVDIEVSDALKGLKAVTRAAKKATAALNELEEQQSKLSGISVTFSRELIEGEPVDGWKTFEYAK
jgi:hypothetical protein